MKKYCKNPDCGYTVDENFKGKCPKCDSVGWKLSRKIDEPPIIISDFVSAELKKMDRKALENSLRLLSQRQEAIRRAIEPLSKIQTSKISKQISQMQKTLGALNLDKIKIPKTSFNVDDVLLKFEEPQSKGFSMDVILVKAAETNPELKEAVESKDKIETADKTLNDVSDQIKVLQKTSDRNFKDVGDKQDEHHTEQMAEHQKTRDELLIDNGKLQEKIDNLERKIKDGWKDPKNWSIGIVISVVAGLILLAVSSFS